MWHVAHPSEYLHCYVKPQLPELGTGQRCGQRGHSPGGVRGTLQLMSLLPVHNSGGRRALGAQSGFGYILCPDCAGAASASASVVRIGTAPPAVSVWGAHL